MKGHGDKNILKFCQVGPESPESKPSIHAAEVTSLRDWARTLFQTDTLGIYPLATSSGARHSTNTKRWHAQELRHYMQMSTPLLTETPGTPPVNALSICGLIYTRESIVSTGSQTRSTLQHYKGNLHWPFMNFIRKFPPAEPSRRQRPSRVASCQHCCLTAKRSWSQYMAVVGPFCV